MPFSLNSRNGGGRYRPLAEINVTPLVDVMLVLLIIFMVTAPLMTTGVTVDLPSAKLNPVNNDSEPLNVSIKADGLIYLQDQQVDEAALTDKLKALAKDNMDRRIYVRGDKSLAYGRVLEVMGTINQGGFGKVALISDPTGLPASAPAPAAAPKPPAPAARPKAG
jgi:biopolymer transport protein TolR